MKARADEDTDCLGIMQLVDSLAGGGAERVAVNLANQLPRQQFHLHLCTTRDEGPLAPLIHPDVGRIQLDRKRTFDPGAIRRLSRYISDHGIQVLHAHGTSVLVACAASLLPPFPYVIWHDHYGMYAVAERPVWIYRNLARRLAGVIAVNQPLVQWSRERLKVAHDRVWYVPNFICPPETISPVPGLPGNKERRITCVANLRVQKDHLSLVEAMAEVIKAFPDAHLLLVGDRTDEQQSRRVEVAIDQYNVGQNIHLLGRCDNVSDILHASSIGVIASKSEGLPLALLEYGAAGLPVVSTNVGQCPEVLLEGEAGVLVPPSSPGQMADQIVQLLHSFDKRKSLGVRLRENINKNYSMHSAITTISNVYRRVIGLTDKETFKRTS